MLTTLFSYEYGETITVTADMEGKTLSVEYYRYSAEVRFYKTDNNGEYVSFNIGLGSESNASASFNAPLCSMNYDGHAFIAWSDTMNSLSHHIYKPGATISYSNSLSDGQIIKLYAVWAEIPSISTQTYTGSDLTPMADLQSTDITVVCGSASEAVSYNNSDQASSTKYGLSYSNNRNAGTARINITMPSNKYSNAQFSFTFTINPAVVNIIANNASKDYGDSDPVFTGTITCSTAPTNILNITFIRSNENESPGTYIGVITATYTNNSNYQVNITTADFTIRQTDTVRYIILDGGGGDDTEIIVVSLPTGSQFPDKNVSANSGYSFYEWVRVTYNGNTIISFTHITYSPTLRSEDISPGTYMAMFVPGDSISFNGNGGTGSMSDQSFGDRSGTLSTNTFEKEGNIFVGWSLSSNGDVVYTDNMPLSRISGLSTNDASNVLYAVWRPCTYTSEIIWTNDVHILVSNDSYLRMNDDDTYPVINGSDKATISSSWLNVLSDNNKGLIVELDLGEITFDDDCIDTFAATEKDVTISIRTVNSRGNGTFDIENEDEVLAIYSITASYIDNNGDRVFIHALNGYAIVTVDKPHGGSSVVYVGDNGGQPTDVTTDANTITFTTEHFSLYGIVEECGSDASISDVPATEKEDASTVLLIGIAAGITTTIAAALVIQRRRL